jgi:hypothetical protein
MGKKLDIDVFLLFSFIVVQRVSSTFGNFYWLSRFSAADVLQKRDESVKGIVYTIPADQCSHTVLISMRMLQYFKVSPRLKKPLNRQYHYCRTSLPILPSTRSSDGYWRYIGQKQKHDTAEVITTGRINWDACWNVDTLGPNYGEGEDVFYSLSLPLADIYYILLMVIVEHPFSKKRLIRFYRFILPLQGSFVWLSHNINRIDTGGKIQRIVLEKGSV